MCSRTFAFVIACFSLGLAACTELPATAPTPGPITLMPSMQTQLAATATALRLTDSAGLFTATTMPTATPPPDASSTLATAPLPTETPSLTQIVSSTPTASELSPNATATLAPITPAILQFTIAPERINPGEPITLMWATTGDAVTISTLDPLGRWGPTIHTGPPSGTLALATSVEARNSVTYIVTASLDEQYAWQAATATLNCPDTWFFPNPPADCPWPAHFTAMQAQRFEHGLMLWTEWNDAIYILYDSPHWYRWDRLANQWFAGMQESDPSIIPPTGLYQPVRGFGVAWRMGYVSPVQVVRDRLGWALGEEFAVSNAAHQCDTKPKYATCYISGPDGLIYILGPEHTGGDVWAGPTPKP